MTKITSFPTYQQQLFAESNSSARRQWNSNSVNSVPRSRAQLTLLIKSFHDITVYKNSTDESAID